MITHDYYDQSNADRDVNICPGNEGTRKKVVDSFLSTFGLLESFEILGYHYFRKSVRNGHVDCVGTRSCRLATFAGNSGSLFSGPPGQAHGDLFQD
jgi:hypothetical protein